MMILLKKLQKHRHKQLIYALALSNMLSVVLFLSRVVASGGWRYAFILWNLVLAVVPLFFALWLIYRLRTTLWSDNLNIVISLLWLGFLPNSFYIVSDLIHIHDSGEVSILFDVTVFFSTIFNAYVAGFTSLYLIHEALLKRLKYVWAHATIGFILLLCGFAIYLGRFLRWNTWDVLANPAGLLFDVSDRFVNPSAYPQFFVTTITFFAVLGSMYIVIWQLVKGIRNQN